MSIDHFCSIYTTTNDRIIREQENTDNAHLAVIRVVFHTR